MATDHHRVTPAHAMAGRAEPSAEFHRGLDGINALMCRRRAIATRTA